MRTEWQNGGMKADEMCDPDSAALNNAHRLWLAVHQLVMSMPLSDGLVFILVVNI